MSGLPDFLIAKRKLLALSVMGLIVLIAAGCLGLQMKTHYSVFFDDSDPNLVAHQTLETEFTPADNVYFVIRPAEGSVYNGSTLAAIDRLTALSWELPYSVRVDSLSNYHQVTESDNELLVSELYDNPQQLTEAGLKTLADAVATKPELNGLLVASDGSFAGVNVNLALPYASEKAAQEVTEAARVLKNQLLQEYPGIRIDILGQVPFNWVFNEMAMKDGETLFAIMFLVMFLVIGFFFRSVAAVGVTLIVISAASAAAMGLGGLLGYSLNAINLIAGTIIMTVAVADCVHLLTEFNHNARDGRSPQEAMKQSLLLNYWPVTVTSITTAIGFLGLNFSASPPFRELGNMTAFGVLMAWVLSLCVFPALYLWFLKDSKYQQIAHSDAGQGGWLQTRLPDWIIKTQPRYLVMALSATFVLIALMPLNKLDERVLTYFDEDVPFRAAVERIQDKMLGFDRIAFSISSTEENGVSDPALLQFGDRFTEWARSQPEVTHVATYTDVIKELNRVMNEGNQYHYRIPDDREQAAQLQLLYEMSLPFGADIKHLVSHDKDSLRISVGLKSQSAKGLLGFDRKASEWMAANLPPEGVTVSPGASVSMMFAHIGMTNIKSMISGNIVVTLLVTACLIVFLGSVKFGLLSVLPNIVPALVTFGLWGLFVGEINMAIAVVFCITLGIVVDDTVHFTAKYLHGRRAMHLPPAQAIQFAYAKVSRALMITTLVLTAGFLVLCFSSLRINSAMGLLVALTIVVAFVFDLFVYPRLLLAVERRAALAIDTNGQAGDRSAQERQESEGSASSA